MVQAQQRAAHKSRPCIGRSPRRPHAAVGHAPQLGPVQPQMCRGGGRRPHPGHARARKARHAARPLGPLEAGLAPGSEEERVPRGPALPGREHADLPAPAARRPSPRPAAQERQRGLGPVERTAGLRGARGRWGQAQGGGRSRQSRGGLGPGRCRDLALLPAHAAAGREAALQAQPEGAAGAEHAEMRRAIGSFTVAAVSA
mmetsp:Transcript_80899/g.237819  ORF Transcript_80899/g.237819 Transcript_80899/m.237819 type:complete len:201 (+) Transcript_80899:1001-1603(+)